MPTIVTQASPVNLGNTSSILLPYTQILTVLFFCKILFPSGKKKLCLEEKEECSLFEEYDGTEVDDDESLIEYEKGSSFVLGKEWIANPGTASTQSSADAFPKEATKEHQAHFSEVLDETKTKEPPTSWHEVAEIETGSEEDINCSTAETSGYAITRISVVIVFNKV